jgi:hypothetical protein
LIDYFDYSKTYLLLSFEVLTAADIKIIVCWDVTPCTVVDMCHVSEELDSEYQDGLSETPFYPTT